MSRRFISTTKIDQDVIKARKKAEKEAEKAAEKERKKYQNVANELFGLQPTLTSDRKKKMQEQHIMMGPVGAVGGFIGMGHYHHPPRPQALSRSTAPRPRTAV
jgi:amino acid permease